MTDSVDGSDVVDRGLEALSSRLGSLDDPGAIEAVEALRTAVDELRSADEELARQNDELGALRQALAEEADRFRSLFDEAPIAYVATDLKGVILDANAGAGALLGVEPRWLVGKPLPVYVVAADRRLVRRYLHEVGAAGTAGPLQARVERRSSIPLDAVLRAVATRTEVRWVIQDVSEARQAEQRLWDLNADLERRVLEQAGEIAAVVDQLPIGVVFVDRYGMPKRANLRAHEILGDEVEAGTGAWADAFSRLRRDGTPLDRSEWPSTRALRGEVIEHDLSTVETRDGRQIIVDVSAVPIRDDAGAITSAVVTFDDVTERERLERADREFVVNAAHQIRTPITAIASAAAALEAGAKNDPEDRDRFLHHIEREVGRLARLGEALLTLARVERGEAVANLSIVPLAEVAWALADEARATYGASVGVDCPPTLAALTNQPLVEQAIANLLENAVKYARHGQIDITAWRDGDCAVLEIRDSGPGMPPAVSERAFERFHRAGDDHTGFGLGLAIANNAVRACGGELELRSTPGVGTTAVITLPAATLVVQ